MTEELTCPTCQTPDLVDDDMCQHKPKSLCLICCLGGEHDWTRHDERNAA